MEDILLCYMLIPDGRSEAIIAHLALIAVLGFALLESCCRHRLRPALLPLLAHLFLQRINRISPDIRPPPYNNAHLNTLLECLEFLLTHPLRDVQVRSTDTLSVCERLQNDRQGSGLSARRKCRWRHYLHGTRLACAC
jgi:hypothetical protein